MWYLIQTKEGEEQKLIDAIRKRAGEAIAGRCFLMRREVVWRREGRCIPHVEILFPGCVFAEDDGKENFTGRLKEILSDFDLESGKLPKQKKETERAQSFSEPPADARLRGEAFVRSEEAKKKKDHGSSDHPFSKPSAVIHPIREADREILEQLLDGDGEHIVRLSPVQIDEEDAEKRIIHCEGPLRHYQEDIVKKRTRLRYVVVRLPFLGGLWDVLLGIRLPGDEGAAETVQEN